MVGSERLLTSNERRNEIGLAKSIVSDETSKRANGVLGFW